MKNLKKTLKSVWLFLLDLPRQWKADTPKIAKWIRNTFTTLGAAIFAFNSAIVSISASTPSWYSDNVWYFIGGCAAIVVLAGTKEVKPKAQE